MVRCSVEADGISLHNVGLESLVPKYVNWVSSKNSNDTRLYHSRVTLVCRGIGLLLGVGLKGATGKWGLADGKWQMASGAI